VETVREWEEVPQVRFEYLIGHLEVVWPMTGFSNGVTRALGSSGWIEKE